MLEFKKYAIISLSIMLSSCWLFSENVDYRQEMRNFVIGIDEYSKLQDSNLYIIPQNGIELITVTDDSDGAIATEYLSAIDGNGQEDLFYGYHNDDEQTPVNESSYLTEYLDISNNNGKVILVTDYCSTHIFIDNSLNSNNSRGYISYAADQRNLNNIPEYPAAVHSKNSRNISTISEIENFLYLINPENYGTRNAFIDAVINTNYDLIIMDLFFNDGSLFSAAEVSQLRQKANGGSRLVLCYMSIGEAEDYRYYWQADWEFKQPVWLDKENPDWEGNYKVKYWETDWQSIIFGSNDSYVYKIIDAGFDGLSGYHRCI